MFKTFQKLPVQLMTPQSHKLVISVFNEVEFIPINDLEIFGMYLIIGLEIRKLYFLIIEQPLDLISSNLEPVGL